MIVLEGKLPWYGLLYFQFKVVTWKLNQAQTLKIMRYVACIPYFLVLVLSCCLFSCSLLVLLFSCSVAPICSHLLPLCFLAHFSFWFRKRIIGMELMFFVTNLLRKISMIHHLLLEPKNLLIQGKLALSL